MNSSKLPFYKQEKLYSCVPACLRMVLAGYGLEISETELCAACDCTPFAGTDVLQAIEAMRRLGFTNSAKHTLSWLELIKLRQDEVYPVVFVSLQPIDGVRDTHAMIVAQVTDKSVVVYDPLQGERILSLVTFQTAWALQRNLALVILP